jgi:hypothetical protein
MVKAPYREGILAMRNSRWLLLVASISILVVGAALTSIAAPGNTRARLRSGWIGTGRAGTGHRPVAAPKTDTRIHNIFVVKNVRFNSKPKGFDELAVSGPLWNPSETRKVGFGAVHCTFLGLKSGLSECEGTFNLGAAFPGGNQITIQGMSSPATHWFNAITGGTGSFSNADGQVEVRNIAETNKIDQIFHIDL